MVCHMRRLRALHLRGLPRWLQQPRWLLLLQPLREPARQCRQLLLLCLIARFPKSKERRRPERRQAQQLTLSKPGHNGGPLCLLPRKALQLQWGFPRCSQCRGQYSELVSQIRLYRRNRRVRCRAPAHTLGPKRVRARPREKERALIREKEKVRASKPSSRKRL